jgi:hypothetical protein
MGAGGQQEFSKANERSGNVYENKGAVPKTLAQSGNTYENTRLSRRKQENH